MMITYRLVVTAVLTLFLSNHTYAEQVKRNMPACVSEDALDELITYANKKDNTGMMQLFTSGQCTRLTAGETVSVISPGFMTATIRYKGQKLYTPSEAVR